MAKRFNARYTVHLANGNRQNADIDFDFPEDIGRSSLYMEEKQHGRVSNIIANLTGYSASSIELRELKELNSHQINSERKSEQQRKQDVKNSSFMQKLNEERAERDAKRKQKMDDVIKLHEQLDAEDRAKRSKSFDDIMREAQIELDAKREERKRQKDLEDAEKENRRKNGKDLQEFNNGDIYDGYFLNGKRHGKGKYLWSNGDIYEGEWLEGKRDGKGKCTYSNDDKYLSYDGDWFDDCQLGSGIIKYKNGSIYEGEVEYGEPHGIGKLTASNGDIKQGTWRGLENCIESGRIDYENGNFYDGDILDGEPHGRGKLTESNGGFQEGEWYYGRWSNQNNLIIKSLCGYNEDTSEFIFEYYEGEIQWYIDPERSDAYGKGLIKWHDGSFYKGEVGFHSEDCLIRYPHGLGLHFDNSSNNEKYGKWEYGELIQELQQPFNEEKIQEIIKNAIIAIGARSKSDIGKVIAAVKDELNGRVDNKKVSSMVVELIEESQKEITQNDINQSSNEMQNSFEDSLTNKNMDFIEVNEANLPQKQEDALVDIFYNCLKQNGFVSVTSAEVGQFTFLKLNDNEVLYVQGEKFETTDNWLTANKILGSINLTDHAIIDGLRLPTVLEFEKIQEVLHAVNVCKFHKSHAYWTNEASSEFDDCSIVYSFLEGWENGSINQPAKIRLVSTIKFDVLDTLLNEIKDTYQITKN